VGLKSNRSFCDFPYYGKIRKSEYCPTENPNTVPQKNKKEKKQALPSSAKCAVNNPNVSISVGQYLENKIRIL
jgi:hypothetical protein